MIGGLASTAANTRAEPASFGVETELTGEEGGGGVWIGEEARGGKGVG